jgi:pimeloyl-ACP methyl ester carboxylesterase
VIVHDEIGFGESSHPPEADYAPPAQAERLRSLAQASSMTRIHLGGSSTSRQIAMSYAALHPTEVASLCLLDLGGLGVRPLASLEQLSQKPHATRCSPGTKASLRGPCVRDGLGKADFRADYDRFRRNAHHWNA